MYRVVEIKSCENLFVDEFIKFNDIDVITDNDIQILKDIFYEKKILQYKNLSFNFEASWTRKKGLKIIENTLSNNSLFERGLCPVCSVTIDKLDIDHYYNKNDYKSFIYFPYNLTPCCRNCNTRNKSDNITFHPYIDNISESLFSLSIDIIYEENGKKFHLKNKDIIFNENYKFGKEYKNLLLNHSLSLGLNSLINDKINYVNKFLDLEIEIKKIKEMLYNDLEKDECKNNTCEVIILNEIINNLSSVD